MKAHFVVPSAVVVLVLLTACGTSGTAAGQLHKTGSAPEPVFFNWKSDGVTPERGTIAGTLVNGRRYTGYYHQVAENVPEQVYANAWSGAEPYWPDWPIVRDRTSDRKAANTFAAQYMGQVIASLTADDQKSTMRCRFTIEVPSAGLARGGSGACKLSDGTLIEPVVLGK
jgi:hypothetical protein